MARRAFTSHPLVVRRVAVRRIEEVTPRMRRIVVGGDGLLPSRVDGHEQPGFAAPGFDDHIKIILASDDDIDSALPAQLPHGIEWTPAENRITRDYTPRRVDLDAREIDLDFVLHGDGPAAAWAKAARPGDALCFVGPKSSIRLPERLDWIVLIADETGLPAVGRFLDERPVDVPVHVIAVIEHPDAKQQFAVREGDSLVWHVANGDDAGALDAAVRALPIPEGDGYAWAAAESRALLPVRRYLGHEVGLPKERLNITGYWAAEAQTDATPDSDAAAPIASPLPWLVVRSALQLGVIDALADAPCTLDALADAAGMPTESLRAMLPVLSAHGVVTGSPEALRLGVAGEELLDEHEREALTGHEADVMLALAGLAPAIRTGVPAWQQATGESLAARADSDPDVYGELVEHASGLSFLLGALVADPLWHDVRSCLLAGPGTPAVVGAIEDARMSIALSVLDGGAARPVLRDALEPPASVSWEPAASDLAVLARHLDHRTDAEAVQTLREIAPLVPRAVVVERARPDRLGPGAAEEQVLSLVRTGSPLRDRATIAHLASRAGWSVERVLELGWGMEATVLIRS